MPKTFLLRPRRVTFIPLLLSACLVVSAQAQHGGGGGGHFGGGHFGGGHFGGGHSSHSQTSAGQGAGHHWGWFHLGSRNRRNRVAAENLASKWRATLGGQVSHAGLPSTYIQTVPLRFTISLPDARFGMHSRFQHHPEFFFGGFRRLRNSGCSFNGFNQVCFFEPTWPLFWFSGFDWFPFGFGFGYGDDTSADTSDAFASADMTAAPAPDSEAPDNVSNNNSTASEQPLRGQNLDPRFFVLILKNGTDHVVTDYWLSDGYIEYVSRDGTQSHIPVDALDLQETVRSNSARGLRFVLRSAP